MKKGAKKVFVTLIAATMAFCSACGEPEVCTHSFGDWYTQTEATCTDDGVARRDCGNCETFETKTIEKKGHSFGEYYETLAETCTEDGSERRDCENDGCEEYETRIIPYSGHDCTDWYETKAPTCEDAGEMRRDCKADGCDFFETKETLCLTHDFTDWYETKAATCQTAGEERRDCENDGCEEFEVRETGIGSCEFEDGICIYCYEPEEGYVFTTGQVKAEANYSGRGASDWNVDRANGTYTSTTAQNAMLTFKNWKFEGGIIEWDMMVPSDQYTFGSSIGIMFGSYVENATTGGESDTYYVMGRAWTSEFVGYSKNQGVMLWEDVAKLSPPTITCVAGETYRYRVEWDNVNNVITLTFGDQRVSFNPRNILTGGYFGLYSEVEGVQFSNITVTPKTYEATGGVSICNWSIWSIGKDENGLTYTCESPVGLLMFDTLNFTKGTIEWDMYVPSDTGYHFGTLCGVVWGASTNKADYNVSTFYCSGRYAGGIFVTYAKYLDSNGATQFAWENANQITDGTLMPAATTVSYKLEFDGTVFTLSVGGVTVSVTPVNKLSGNYFGLYAELAGTVFSNIRVTNVD